MKWKIKHHGFLAGESTTTGMKMRQIDGGLCTTAEKWFARGESNVFRLSRDYVNGLS
jgi:hypothetical protein